MRFKILSTSLLLTAFFLSCMTEKKARRNAEEFYKTHPGELATNCAEKFPPVLTYKPGDTVLIPGDTITVKGDSVECPQGPNDAVLIRPLKVKCPDNKTIFQTLKIVDTVEVENTAKVAALQYRLDTTGARLNTERGRSQEIERERNQARREAKKNFYFVLGLLAIIAAYVFIKIKKRI